MNNEVKELYIKKTAQYQKGQEIKHLIYKINHFLGNKNITKFKTPESLEALKRIKAYLETQELELTQTKKNWDELDKKLFPICNHEIAIKDRFDYTYCCLMCGHQLDTDTIKKPLISIDVKDYPTKVEICQIFKDIINSDKDLITTMSEALEEMQYETEIKIYRRTK